MAELRFEALEEGNQVQIQIFDLDPPSMTVDFLKGQFNLTEYRDFFLMEDALTKALSLFKNHQAAVKENPDLEGEPVEVIVAEKKEAIIQVEISSDKMSCHLAIETAYGAPNPDFDDLKEALSDKKVIMGVNEGVLKSIANKLPNVAPGSMVKELVAKGKSAGQSKQAKIDLLIQPLQDRLMKPQLRADGTVDMHDFGDIEMVEPGDQLARRTPPVVGEPGFNVLGENVEAIKPEDRQLGVGEGAEISSSDENLLIASRKGVPLKIQDGVEVSEAYVVKDVDLHTGNIDFDGTVVVQGSVKEGMEVKATKKVMVQNYVESACIISEHDVVIGKGVLGHKADKKSSGDEAATYSAKIVCGGDFFANYIQYADISVAKKCSVSKHILHSHINAEVIELESPKKSEAKVIGGLLQPKQKLLCNTLGGPSYIHTKVDFSTRLDSQLRELKQVNDELVERINVARGMNAALRDIENKTSSKEAMEQAQKITNTIKHFQGLVSELKEKRKAIQKEIDTVCEEFEVCVKQNLYPGVEIQFVEKVIPVKQEKPCCRLKKKDEGLAFFSL